MDSVTQIILQHIKSVSASIKVAAAAVKINSAQCSRLASKIEIISKTLQTERQTIERVVPSEVLIAITEALNACLEYISKFKSVSIVNSEFDFRAASEQFTTLEAVLISEVRQVNVKRTLVDVDQFSNQASDLQDYDSDLEAIRRLLPKILENTTTIIENSANVLFRNLETITNTKISIDTVPATPHSTNFLVITKIDQIATRQQMIQSRSKVIHDHIRGLAHLMEQFDVDWKHSEVEITEFVKDRYNPLQTCTATLADVTTIDELQMWIVEQKPALETIKTGFDELLKCLRDRVARTSAYRVTPSSLVLSPVSSIDPSSSLPSYKFTTPSLSVMMKPIQVAGSSRISSPTRSSNTNISTALKSLEQICSILFERIEVGLDASDFKEVEQTTNDLMQKVYQQTDLVANLILSSSSSRFLEVSPAQLLREKIQYLGEYIGDRHRPTQQHSFPDYIMVLKLEVTEVLEYLRSQYAVPFALHSDTNQPPTSSKNFNTNPGSVETQPSASDDPQRLSVEADQGSVASQRELGLLYIEGLQVAVDYPKARRYLELAATSAGGDPVAQFHLASLYEQGLGVDKNETKAVQLYQLAANQRYAPAQCSLGIMYEEGRGIERDVINAVHWYRRAATTQSGSEGDAKGQFKLGTMYAKGCGVVKSEATAIYWYQKAAAHGLVEAQHELSVLQNKEGPS